MSATVPEICIASIFPEAIESVFETSILRRAQLDSKLNLRAMDIRDFADDKHKSVDAKIYGGGAGMLFKPDVLEKMLESYLESRGHGRSELLTLMTSPRGYLWDQEAAWKLTRSISKPYKSVVVICGRYEGIDHRFIEKWVDLEVSLGDYILSGGEIAGLAIVDSVVRLIPGVLGNAESVKEESFSAGLLEYPQYTKPLEYKGNKVPEVLSSGHHGNVAQWRLRQSLLLTAAFRPDMITAHKGENLPEWGLDLLNILKKRCTYPS